MFSSHAGIKKDSAPDPIQQKVYFYLSPEGEIGITKKNLETKSNNFIVTYCQGLKKNLATTKAIVEKILQGCSFPLELYCYADDLSYSQIIEGLEKDSRAIIGENIYIYQEGTGNKLEDRISEIRNYLNMNENAYICKNEELKYTIYLELNRVPLSANAISFLMAAEDAIAPSYQEIAQVQAQFKKYNDFPFENEIYLADVTKMFDR